MSSGTTKTTSPMLGIVTVVSTLIGWSSVPLFVNYLSKYIDVWTSNGWRYVISAAMWAPLLVVLAMKGKTPAGLYKAAIVPAIFNALGQAAFGWAFYNIDPATATFGLRLQIVFIAVGAYVMFPGERGVLRSPWALLGIALLVSGIGGTLFLADHGNMPTEVVGARPDYTLGVTLAVSSGLLFGAYALAVRKLMHGFPSVTSFAAISQYTSLILVVLMLICARKPNTSIMDFGYSGLTMGWDKFGLLVASSVVGIGLGHVFYYISIARLGVAVSSGVMQLQPFCVAVAQLVLYGTAMTNGQWTSGVIAVIGATLLLGVQWSKSQAAARKPADIAEDVKSGAEPSG